jgi:hypothetical protein
MQFRDKDGVAVATTRAMYVRVKAATAGLATVRQCAAGLISVRKKQPDGSYDKSIIYETHALPWSNKGPSPIDIGAHGSEYIDVLYVTMDQNALMLTGKVPFRLGGLFANPGAYEPKLAVTSADDGSSTYSFIVRWNGQWNEIELCDVPTEITAG